jgi:hypothetical protein
MSRAAFARFGVSVLAVVMDDMVRCVFALWCDAIQRPRTQSGFETREVLLTPLNYILSGDERIAVVRMQLVCSVIACSVCRYREIWRRCARLQR